MNKINKILFTLLTIVLVACEKNVINDIDNAVAGFDYPTTETTDEYSVTYQYKEGVIVLDDKAQTYLVSVEADTILYFSSNTPSSILPDVGDVISARVTRKTPYGLGNIVLEKSESGGLIKCVTTLTGLDNIFEELTWEYYASLTDSILSGYTDENGDRVEPSYVWYDEEGDSIIKEEIQETRISTSPYKYYVASTSRVTVGNKKLITLPIKAEKGGVRLTGDISIGAFMHCSGDLRKKTFDFCVQPVIDISAGSKIGIMYNPNLYQDINEYPLFKLKDIANFTILIGPVVLRPYVNVETYVDFGASGTVDLEFEKTFSAKIGYSQKKGGYIINSTNDGPENRFLKSVSLDGNVSIDFKCVFDVGCGLYVKNIALELNPYLTCSVGADCRLTGNENGWRSSSTIDLDINVGADGRFVFNWFDRLKLTPTINFIDTNLLHKEWPLLPIVDESTFSVKRDRSSSALVFDAKYYNTGGILSLFTDIYPGIAVYKGGELIYKKMFPSKTQYNKKHKTSFKLDGLKEDVAYTAKPIIKVIGIEQELDGIPFSSTSPTAAVTDIVQTSAEFGIFYYKGNEYAYEFNFYVNSHLIGSENCSEWGIYDPNSEQVYNSFELKDGRNTSYWTAYSNNPSTTFTKTPYVKLLDGSEKVYETHTHNLHYGWGNVSSNKVKVPSIQSYSSDLVIKLDSIIYEK